MAVLLSFLFLFSNGRDDGRVDLSGLRDALFSVSQFFSFFRYGSVAALAGENVAADVAEFFLDGFFTFHRFLKFVIGVAVRFSLFDMIPFVKGPDGVGRPMAPEASPAPQGPSVPRPFGAAADCLSMDPDLEEPAAFLDMMRDYGVELICGTIGSPYYCVHIQRPAYFPVSDGYLPPQDPLRSVALHVAAARRLKERRPWAKIILSGLTCLQEYAGCAAEAAVRDGAADFAGLGRMALPYPDYCADHLAGGGLDRRRICRTFGECTNAPRRGEVSGCYPLDAFYKQMGDRR